MHTTVVLAGGRSTRFGEDKTRALLGGVSLLDRVLRELPSDDQVIVVGEPRPTVRPVRWEREEPEFGGPLAALAAALPEVRSSTFTLVGGDMPQAAPALDVLAEMLLSTPVDAVLATDPEGRRQPLLAAYRTDAVRAAMPTSAQNLPLRALLHELDVTTLPVDVTFSADVDTQDDLAELIGSTRTDTARADREAELISFYSNEVAARKDREPPAERISHLREFADRLRVELRHHVLEVGTGPGRDAIAMQQAGFTVSGVDLAPPSVRECRAAGLDVRLGSALRLPFDDAEFDAAYSLSTLLHVADADLDTALAELVRVLVRGAPVAIGLWGAPHSHEEHQEHSPYGPRYFALRSDEDLRTALGRHGRVEQFESWPPERYGWHYQWAVLRTPGR